MNYTFNTRIYNLFLFYFAAEEWDDYFRQYPGDFVVEALDGSPRKPGSASGQGSPRGSPTHKSHGRSDLQPCLTHPWTYKSHYMPMVL